MPLMLKIVYWPAVAIMSFFFIGVAQDFDKTPLRTAMLSIGLVLLWGGATLVFLWSTSPPGERHIMPRMLKIVYGVVYWTTAVFDGVLLGGVVTGVGHNVGYLNPLGILWVLSLALPLGGSLVVFFRSTSVLGRCATLGLVVLPLLATVGILVFVMPNTGTRR
jgi:hypothetical protein